MKKVEAVHHLPSSYFVLYATWSNNTLLASTTMNVVALAATTIRKDLCRGCPHLTSTMRGPKFTRKRWKRHMRRSLVGSKQYWRPPQTTKLVAQFTREIRTCSSPKRTQLGQRAEEKQYDLHHVGEIYAKEGGLYSTTHFQHFPLEMYIFAFLLGS